MGSLVPEDDRDLELKAAFKAGQTDQRIANIEAHQIAVNGSIEKQANAQEALLVVVSGLSARLSLAGKIGLVFLTAWVTAMTYLLIHVS